MKLNFSTLFILLALLISLGSCSKKEKELSPKETRTKLLVGKKWRMNSRLHNGQQTINDFFRSNTYTYNTDGTVLYTNSGDPGTVRYWEWANEEATQLKFYYYKNDPDVVLMTIVKLTETELQYTNLGYRSPREYYDITLVPGQ